MNCDHYLFGLDEAGYGPNLGPLVQAAVGMRLPRGMGCLWQALADVVHRAADPAGGRILIDDSKRVYSGPHGLAKLELGVGASLVSPVIGSAAELVDCIGVGTTVADLHGEPWFDQRMPLPIAANPDAIKQAVFEMSDAVRRLGVTFRSPRCMVTPAPRFNAIVECEVSKAAVLARGVIELLRDCFALVDGPVTFVIDKQGGRNSYAPMIQHAFPNGWVVTERESSRLSQYRVEMLPHPVQLKFLPRAESECMAVALASMVAKYLRELLMVQFNGFWKRHVPEVAPTAGYPSDAPRFLAAIRPAMKRLGIREANIWRMK
jgi:hypothetical protein